MLLWESVGQPCKDALVGVSGAAVQDEVCEVLLMHGLWESVGQPCKDALVGVSGAAVQGCSCGSQWGSRARRGL
jgi:hypothetical protein